MLTPDERRSGQNIENRRVQNEDVRQAIANAAQPRGLYREEQERMRMEQEVQNARANPRVRSNLTPSQRRRQEIDAIHNFNSDIYAGASLSGNESQDRFFEVPELANIRAALKGTKHEHISMMDPNLRSIARGEEGLVGTIARGVPRTLAIFGISLTEFVSHVIDLPALNRLLWNAGEMLIGQELSGGEEYGNWYSDWMQELRQGMDQSGGFMRANVSNPNESWTQIFTPMFWFENMPDIVAVGASFALGGAGTGSILAKGASLASSASIRGTQAIRGLNAINKATGQARGFLGYRAMEQGLLKTGHVTNGFLLAYSEGAMEASSTMNTVFDENLINGSTVEEASRLAALAAANAVTVNTLVNGVFNLTLTSGLFKAPNQAQRASSILNIKQGEKISDYAKRLNDEVLPKNLREGLMRSGAIEGSQEIGEEWVNLVSGEFGLWKARSQMTDEEGNSLDNRSLAAVIRDNMFTDEAIIAGALGFFGGFSQSTFMGGIERTMIKRDDAGNLKIWPFNKTKDGSKLMSQHEWEQNAIAVQFNERKQLLATQTSDLIDSASRYGKAIQSGNQAEAQQILDSTANKLAVSSAIAGNSDVFIGYLNEIISSSDDPNAPEKAREQIKTQKAKIERMRDTVKMLDENYFNLSNNERLAGAREQLLSLYLESEATQFRLEVLERGLETKKKAMGNDGFLSLTNEQLSAVKLQNAINVVSKVEQVIESLKNAKDDKEAQDILQKSLKDSTPLQALSKDQLIKIYETLLTDNQKKIKDIKLENDTLANMTSDQLENTVSTALDLNDLNDTDYLELEKNKMDLEDIANATRRRFNYLASARNRKELIKRIDDMVEQRMDEELGQIEIIVADSESIEEKRGILEYLNDFLKRNSNVTKVVDRVKDIIDTLKKELDDFDSIEAKGVDTVTPSSPQGTDTSIPASTPATPASTLSNTTTPATSTPVNTKVSGLESALTLLKNVTNKTDLLEAIKIAESKINSKNSRGKTANKLKEDLKTALAEIYDKLGHIIEFQNLAPADKKIDLNLLNVSVYQHDYLLPIDQQIQNLLDKGIDIMSVLSSAKEESIITPEKAKQVGGKSSVTEYLLEVNKTPPVTTKVPVETTKPVAKVEVTPKVEPAVKPAVTPKVEEIVPPETKVTEPQVDKVEEQIGNLFLEFIKENTGVVNRIKQFKDKVKSVFGESAEVGIIFRNSNAKLDDLRFYDKTESYSLPYWYIKINDTVYALPVPMNQDSYGELYNFDISGEHVTPNTTKVITPVVMRKGSENNLGSSYTLIKKGSIGSSNSDNPIVKKDNPPVEESGDVSPPPVDPPSVPKEPPPEEPIIPKEEAIPVPVVVTEGNRSLQVPDPATDFTPLRITIAEDLDVALSPLEGLDDYVVNGVKIRGSVFIDPLKKKTRTIDGTLPTPVQHTSLPDVARQGTVLIATIIEHPDFDSTKFESAIIVLHDLEGRFIGYYPALSKDKNPAKREQIFNKIIKDGSAKAVVVSKNNGALIQFKNDIDVLTEADYNTLEFAVVNREQDLKTAYGVTSTNISDTRTRGLSGYVVPNPSGGKDFVALELSTLSEEHIDFVMLILSELMGKDTGITNMDMTMNAIKSYLKPYIPIDLHNAEELDQKSSLVRPPIAFNLVPFKDGRISLKIRILNKSGNYVVYSPHANKDKGELPIPVELLGKIKSLLQQSNYPVYLADYTNNTNMDMYTAERSGDSIILKANPIRYRKMIRQIHPRTTSRLVKVNGVVVARANPSVRVSFKEDINKNEVKAGDSTIDENREKLQKRLDELKKEEDDKEKAKLEAEQKAIAENAAEAKKTQDDLIEDMKKLDEVIDDEGKEILNEILEQVLNETDSKSDIDAKKAEIERRRQQEIGGTTQLRFAKVGDVLYSKDGTKYEVQSKKDKYGRSLEFIRNDRQKGVINPKTVSQFKDSFAFEDLYYKPYSEIEAINAEYDAKLIELEQSQTKSTDTKADIDSSSEEKITSKVESSVDSVTSIAPSDFDLSLLNELSPELKAKAQSDIDSISNIPLVETNNANSITDSDIVSISDSIVQLNDINNYISIQQNQTSRTGADMILDRDLSQITIEQLNRVTKESQDQYIQAITEYLSEVSETTSASEIKGLLDYFESEGKLNSIIIGAYLKGHIFGETDIPINDLTDIDLNIYRDLTEAEMLDSAVKTKKETPDNYSCNLIT